MSRNPLFVLLAPALVLALAGCATTRPVDPLAPPTPTPTASSSTPTPTPTMTSATPTLSPTPTPTEVGESLVLRGDGVGEFTFGARQGAVGQLLTDQLGEPDESSQGILCELDDSSPWAQTVIYGGLWVQFSAKDQSKKSPRYLAAWGFSLAEDFTEPLAMADDVPLNLTFDQLKARYPAGKLEDLNLGEGDGSRMFTLPNKVRFIGADKPESVSAGKLAICE